MNVLFRSGLLVFALLVLGSGVLDAAEPASWAATYEGKFRVGFGGIGDKADREAILADDPVITGIIRKHANIIGINSFYPQVVHPKAGVWNFRDGDMLVDFAERNHLPVRGHVLWWPFHANSTMEWLLKDDKGNVVDRDTAIARMKEHIGTVVGRYKGRIAYWDVVNEVIDNKAPNTMREGLWKDVLGEDMMELAFRFAHEADPQAKLFYNDYGGWEPGKREAIYRLVKRLKDKGVPIDGIGMQDHVKLTGHPTPAELDASISRFEELGLELHVTELDVDMNPDGTLTTFTPEMAEAQARRYRELFDVYLRHAGRITAVMTWNITDASSWLRKYPKPRLNWPLLFDERGQEKPALKMLLLHAAVNTP
jgi:endo-1,4-beta-xylanase